jgi:hypothetical protein
VGAASRVVVCVQVACIRAFADEVESSRRQLQPSLTLHRVCPRRIPPQTQWARRICRRVELARICGGITRGAPGRQVRGGSSSSGTLVEVSPQSSAFLNRSTKCGTRRMSLTSYPRRRWKPILSVQMARGQRTNCTFVPWPGYHAFSYGHFAQHEEQPRSGTVDAILVFIALSKGVVPCRSFDIF